MEEYKEQYRIVVEKSKQDGFDSLSEWEVWAFYMMQNNNQEKASKETNVSSKRQSSSDKKAKRSANSTNPTETFIHVVRSLDSICINRIIQGEDKPVHYDVVDGNSIASFDYPRANNLYQRRRLNRPVARFLRDNYPDGNYPCTVTDAGKYIQIRINMNIAE